MQSQVSFGEQQQTKKVRKNKGKILEKLGRVGKALLFPIAVLPIAAIFLRIGAQIPQGTPFSEFVGSLFLVGGNVVFNNLFILFGIGVAFGLTKDNRGEAALVGFVSTLGLSLILGDSGVGGVDIVDQIYGGINFELPQLDALRSGRFGDLGLPAGQLLTAPDDVIIAAANATLTGFHRLFGTSYNAILAQNVLNGIITGLLIAFIYNKFIGVELPRVLGFFSGRRLIPVLGIIAILFFGLFWALIFPWFGYVLFLFANVLGQATGNQYANAAIAGVYGVLNRFLIPFGLHHIPNTLFWFVLGSHPTADGSLVFGDINIFINGIPEGNTAGTFQTGFFPALMFGLPAIVYAFYRTAESKEQSRRVLSVYAPLALISFLTGNTEPIEFAFVFVSPLLYVTYTLLTGLFAFLINLFGVQIGFGFSAGLIDYLLSIPKSLDIIAANKTGAAAIFANPGWLFPVGIVAFITYYYVVKTMIIKLKLKTPGRLGNLVQIHNEEDVTEKSSFGKVFTRKARMIVAGLGGWKNITNYQNCTTRLRYDVKDKSLVNEDIINDSGAFGINKVGNQMQIIIGSQVELLNDEIQSNIGAEFDISNTTNSAQEAEIKNVVSNENEGIQEFDFLAPIDGKVVFLHEVEDSAFSKMGKGIAIIPKSNEFKIQDEFNLELGFETGHAYIVSKNGVKILIHVGIDTNKIINDEKLQKTIYKSEFSGKKEETLKKGDTLVSVDLDAAKTKKINLITPVVVLNENINVKEVKILVENGKTIKKGTPLFKVL